METENKIVIAGIVILTLLYLLTEWNLSPLQITGLAGEGDFDLDGIPDFRDEYPFDYDNDGMPDTWEKENGLRYDAKDANRDPDGDGISNIEEYRRGTSPLEFNEGEKKKLVQPEILKEPYSPSGTAFKIWVWVFGLLGLILFAAVFVYLWSKRGAYKRPIRRIMPKGVYHYPPPQYYQRKAMEDYRRRVEDYRRRMQQYQSQYYQQRR